MIFHNLYLLFKFAQNYGHEKIKPLGISDTEYLICSYLKEHHHSSQNDIVDAVRLDKGTIARALSSLESKGYVSRVQNRENKRKNDLQLTEKGYSCISELLDVHDNWLTEVSKNLSEKEIHEFDEICAKIVQSAKHLDEKIAAEKQTK